MSTYSKLAGGALGLRVVVGVGVMAFVAWTAFEAVGAKPQAAGEDGGGWISLFDGKTLEGWHKSPQKTVHGTGGQWTVEDGVLVGQQDPPGSGNGGVLLTDRKFGDFELSLEMKPSWGVDSGVFLRSTDQGQCIQMTVDYYNSGNVGQMYGEATGGWVARTFSIEGEAKDRKLLSLKTIKPESLEVAGLEYSCTPEEWLKAWKIGDWNTALIRVEGGRYPKITTSINGLKVCVFNAATSTAASYDKEAVAKTLGERGSIAVQVHGGGSYPVGSKCQWRNIRVREL